MKSLRDELIKLEKLGVEFTSRLYGDGWSVLTVDEVCELAELGDVDKFIIRQLGISERHLRLWKEFASRPMQCHGTTKKRQRCKNKVERYIGVGILDFDPEYDLYCPLHKPESK